MGVSQFPPKDRARRLGMFGLERWRVILLGAGLVDRSGIPDEAPFAGQRSVWHHLRYTCHRHRNHTVQHFCSMILQDQRPALLGVLPKLLRGFIQVLLQAWMGTAANALVLAL